jgi:hypothetical protein
MLTCGSETVVHPFKTPVVHKLYHSDSKARVRFVKWGLVFVHDEEMYPTVVMFRGENWFHLCE